METMNFAQFMDSKTQETKPPRSNKFGENIGDQQNDEIDHICRPGAGPCTDNHEAVIDIDTSKRWCIGRVPPHVREVDEKAYSPKILSIGPFYYKQPGLEVMEVHKLRFLNRLIDQIVISKSVINKTEDPIKDARKSVINDIEREMKAMEKSTRECYSEEFEHINSEDFVKMLMRDACFIVELFRLHEKGSQRVKPRVDVEEPIFGTRWMLAIIGRDLLLMENQLPMVVLEKVFDLTTISNKSTSNKSTTLSELALKFFKTYLRPIPADDLPSQSGTKNTADQVNIKPDHVLALFQSGFVPSKKNNTNSSLLHNITGCSCLPRYCSSGCSKLLSSAVGNGNSLRSTENADNPLRYDNNNVGNASSSLGENPDNSLLLGGNQLRLPQRGWVQNAKTLSLAGVRFSAQAGGSGLVVGFRGSQLMISPLLLGDDTYVHLLRNLLAYEQSSTRALPYVTCFVIFLGSLVDAPDDIKLLLDNGVIKHAKGNNAEIVNLVKSLSWDLRFDNVENCFLTEQIGDINKFSQSKRGKVRRVTIGLLKRFTGFFKLLLVTWFFIQLPIIMKFGGIDCSAKGTPSPKRAPPPPP